MVDNIAYHEIYPPFSRARVRRIGTDETRTLPDSLRVFFVRKLSATRRVEVAVCSVKTSSGIDGEDRRAVGMFFDVEPDLQSGFARMAARWQAASSSPTCTYFSTSRSSDSKFGESDSRRLSHRSTIGITIKFPVNFLRAIVSKLVQA